MQGLDEQLDRLRQLREAAAPELLGHVTADMRAKLAQAQAFTKTLNDVLYPIVTNFRAHKLAPATHQAIWMSLADIRDTLAQLGEAMSGQSPTDQ